MKIRKWTDDQLTDAVSKSTSIRQVILLLGLIPAGGNYEHIHYHIKRLGLSLDHFRGQGWSLGRSLPDRGDKHGLDSY
jgi:hypothetical protein